MNIKTLIKSVLLFAVLFSFTISSREPSAAGCYDVSGAGTALVKWALQRKWDHLTAMLHFRSIASNCLRQPITEENGKLLI